MPYLNKSQAQSLASKKLIKSGCIKENTLGIIDGILDAEFSGIKSHGFHYLPIYCNHLRIGKINGNASPKLEQISSSSIKINADNGFAHTCLLYTSDAADE